MVSYLMPCRAEPLSMKVIILARRSRVTTGGGNGVSTQANGRSRRPTDALAHRRSHSRRDGCLHLARVMTLVPPSLAAIETQELALLVRLKT
jgi:hypothetical protein